MLTNTVRKALGRKKYLAMAIPLLMAAQAQGVEFNIGQIEASFDSQLSLGSSWRVEGRDPNLLTGTQGQTTNADDSNKNYASGDAFSQIFKGSHELQFSYQNYGGFVRGKYWYDSALANNSVDYGHGPTTTVGGITGTGITYNPNQKLDDSDFSELSKASCVALLDAFVYGELDVLDMPLDLRLGKQVVSWGESTFIPGGINAINPWDLNALRRPGAEIKEALLPVNMAYANVGLTENLSAEAFYQLEFEGHALPGCGTYFSSLDFEGTGDCNRVIILDGIASVGRGVDGNREAKDDGQFGVAFRFVSEALGNTEFGLYAMNIHDRAPVFSMIKNNVDEVQIGVDAGATAGQAYADQAVIDLTAQVTSGEVVAGSTEYNDIAAAIAPGAQAAGVAAGQFAGLAAVVADTGYYMAYQEDIQLVGLSFATNVGSMALSGEITHKMDVPHQINGQMLVAAALGGSVGTAAENELDRLVAASAEGAEIDGFRRFDVTQAQVTAIKFFDQVAGASRVTFVGEAGLSFVHSFDESADAIKFGRSGIFGHPYGTDNDGFTTESSWGYRVQISAEYSDVFAGINLKPVLSWSDDVKGYSSVFQEGQQSLGLSLQADYMSTYTAAISLTQYMGGDYSVVSDRDFASFSVSMQF